jgi:hypothetical protein
MLPDDGLTGSWKASGLVFVNPPFSNLADWLAKANDEWDAGNIDKMVMLFPTSRFDLKEFNERTVRAATTLILKKRVRFGSPEKPNSGHQAPFAIALICWGCENDIAGLRAAIPALVLSPQAKGLAVVTSHLCSLPFGSIRPWPTQYGVRQTTVLSGSRITFYIAQEALILASPAHRHSPALSHRFASCMRFAGCIWGSDDKADTART